MLILFQIRPAIPTPGSARVSFLSPCIESTVQLTGPFSSYTSSPTSPFSEPFPNLSLDSFQPGSVGVSELPLSSAYQFSSQPSPAPQVTSQTFPSQISTEYQSYSNPHSNLHSDLHSNLHSSLRSTPPSTLQNLISAADPLHYIKSF